MTCSQCGETLTYTGGCLGEWIHLDGSMYCKIVEKEDNNE